MFGIILNDTPEDLDYDAVLGTWKTSQSADGKETAFACIGDVKQRHLVERTIDFILSGEIPAQDIHGPCSSLANNPNTRNLWWDTMKANWRYKFSFHHLMCSTIYERYSTNMVVLNRLLTGSLNKFSSYEKANDITAFFQDKDVKGFDRVLAQVFVYVEVFADRIEP